MEQGKPEKKARNRRAETSAKKTSLAIAMAEVRQARMDVTSSELMQIAQVFCFIALPYKRTDAREVVRKTRTAEGNAIRVTVRALHAGVDLPYGTDRSLLHWITNQAVITRSPFIALNSASHYLKDMGMAVSGQNIKRVREAFSRIAGTALVIEGQETGARTHLNSFLVRAARLPRGMQIAGSGDQLGLLKSTGEEYGIQLDEAMYREFVMHHMPTLRTFIKVTRLSPQEQDAMLFLQWRSDRAQKLSFISWDQIREQFPSEDSNLSRLRSRFDGAIKELRLSWPELEATTSKAGMEIGPPRGRSRFILSRHEQAEREYQRSLLADLEQSHPVSLQHQQPIPKPSNARLFVEKVGKDGWPPRSGQA